jgi:hypothetical protein
MDGIVFCLLQETNLPNRKYQKIRPMLAFLTCYRVYLANQIKTPDPNRLQAKIFLRFTKSFYYTMKAATNIDGLLIACGPGSSVGIATDYGLDALGIESR